MQIPERRQANEYGIPQSVSSLSPDTLEIFRSLPNIENVYPPIWEIQSYLPYLENLLITRSALNIINPHKATIQLEMAKQEINENTTRIIDPQHTTLLLGYTLKLLKEGRKEVWWSLADKDDIADPQGDTKYSPPLFKHVTLDNIGTKFEELKKYYEKHPESLVKVFPQDGEHPSLCSLILVNEPSEKRLNYKIRPRKYTTDERSELEDPIEINIDLNGPAPIIMINKVEDLKWVQVLINSKELFAGLDRIDLRGSYFIQPECMAYGNGNTTNLKFFSDVIWGDKFDKSPADTPCPKFLPILNQLPNAKIVLNSNSPVMNIILQRHTLGYILHNLNINGNLEILTDQLRQVEAGDPPSNELIIRSLALALAGNLNLPKYVRKIVKLYLGLNELKNANAIITENVNSGSIKVELNHVRGFNPDHPVIYVPTDKPVKKKKRQSINTHIIPVTNKLSVKARLNLLTQEERLTTAEMFWLTGAIRDGSLLADIQNQLNDSIKILTRYAPTIKRYRSLKGSS